MQDENKRSTVIITMEPDGQRIAVNHSANLLSVLLAHGYFSGRMLCNGASQCGGCRVIYDDGVTVRNVQACRVDVYEDCRVEIPAQDDSLKILQKDSFHFSVKDEPVFTTVPVHLRASGETKSIWDRLKRSAPERGSMEWTATLPVLRALADMAEAYESFHVLLDGTEVVDFHPGPALAPLCGIAVDVGTTTLVAYLYEIWERRLLAVESDVNPQTVVAADVISRIHYAVTERDGTGELSRTLRRKLNEMLDRLISKALIDRDSVREIVLAGNTCMQHLLLGISPGCLGRAPYPALVTEAVCCAPSTIGLQLSDVARIYCLPCIGGFVGGDTLAMMVACLPASEQENFLAIDIGTNCEIVLNSQGVSYACSAAAGPAFEGGAIEQGMRAAAGAIDRVWIHSGRLCVHVVDDVAPSGICGSGLVDAVAVLLESGILDASGRMFSRLEAQEAGLAEAWVHRLNERNGVQAFVLSDAVVLTQQDIRQLQLAKAAIAAGIRVLAGTAGIAVAEIDKVFLAGAFGNYMSLDSAIRVGIVPASLRGRIQVAGNAAGAGACSVLLSKAARLQVETLGKTTRHVSLADHPNFSDLYMEELAFPEREA